jgi:hypothetical protein
MAVLLALRTDAEGRVTPAVGARVLAEPTRLTGLPSLQALEAAPYSQGAALADTLGGDDLLELLDADREHLLLLDADEPAQAVPWECAALSDSQLLDCHCGLLHLVSRAGPAPMDSGVRSAACALHRPGRRSPQAVTTGTSSIPFTGVTLADPDGQPMAAERQGSTVAVSGDRWGIYLPLVVRSGGLDYYRPLSTKL